jgi:hypothetical protein
MIHLNLAKSLTAGLAANRAEAAADAAARIPKHVRFQEDNRLFGTHEKPFKPFQETAPLKHSDPVNDPKNVAPLTQPAPTSKITPTNQLLSNATEIKTDCSHKTRSPLLAPWATQTYAPVSSPQKPQNVVVQKVVVVDKGSLLDFFI